MLVDCHAISQLLTLLFWANSVIGAASTAILDNLARACMPVSRPFFGPVWSFAETLTTAVIQRYSRIIHGQLGVWDMIHILAACSIIQAYRLSRTRSMKADEHCRSGVSKRDSIRESQRYTGVFGGSADSGEHIDIHEIMSASIL